MNKINYKNECDKIIRQNLGEQKMPSLLLHACCAPCSSACLNYLDSHFKITVFYYNPNISPKSEFDKRLNEEARFLKEYPFQNPVKLIKGSYNYNEFLSAIRGLESIPEGGKRCFACYRLRLEKTAVLAKNNNFDYFCTTLTLSPLKNSQILNKIGFETAQKYGVNWLPSDFKKGDGYKKSIELSKEYNLYRQNFCGCEFSKREAEQKRIKKETESYE